MLLTQERSHCFLRNLFTFIYVYNQNVAYLLYIDRFLDHTHTSHQYPNIFQDSIKQCDSHLPCVCSFIFSPARKVPLFLHTMGVGWFVLFYILCIYYQQFLHVSLLHNFRSSVKINNNFSSSSAAASPP